jgi:hypothetical protein
LTDFFQLRYRRRWCDSASTLLSIISERLQVHSHTGYVAVLYVCTTVQYVLYVLYCMTESVSLSMKGRGYTLCKGYNKSSETTCNLQREQTVMSILNSILNLTTFIIKNCSKINWITYVFIFDYVHTFLFFHREIISTQQALMVTTSSPLYCMHTKCKMIGR